MIYDPLVALCLSREEEDTAEEVEREVEWQSSSYEPRAVSRVWIEDGYNVNEEDL